MDINAIFNLTKSLLNEHNFERKRIKKLIRISNREVSISSSLKITTSVLIIAHIHLYKEIQSKRLQKPYDQRENSHGEQYTKIMIAF